MAGEVSCLHHGTCCVANLPAQRRNTSVERLCFYGRSHVCLGGDGVALGHHSIVGSPRFPGRSLLR